MSPFILSILSRNGRYLGSLGFRRDMFRLGFVSIWFQRGGGVCGGSGLLGLVRVLLGGLIGGGGVLGDTWLVIAAWQSDI
jgi:hypothetical protein